MLSWTSGIYGRVALARRRFIEARPASRRRLDRPVISVGNLSVGGNGKTPFTAWLAGELAAAGHRPAILSRGYRRTAPTDAVVVVSDGSTVRGDLASAGDEPLMLARGVPGAAVLVCADRHRAGRTAEQELGCTIHLLDDGFQHLHLERDLDLVLVDERDLGDRPLPAGRLREPVEALRSADALLWTSATDDPLAAASRFGVPAAFRLRRTPGPMETEGPPRPHAGDAVIAVAAVARPERFFEELDGAGFDVRARLAYRDHHPYGPDDLARLTETVRTSGAGWVVTTEKDAVRMLPLAPLPFRLAWRGLTVAPDPPAAFRSWLDERLHLSPAVRPARGAGTV